MAIDHHLNRQLQQSYIITQCVYFQGLLLIAPARKVFGWALLEMAKILLVTASPTRTWPKNYCRVILRERCMKETNIMFNVSNPTFRILCNIQKSSPCWVNHVIKRVKPQIRLRKSYYAIMQYIYVGAWSISTWLLEVTCIVNEKPGLPYVS